MIKVLLVDNHSIPGCSLHARIAGAAASGHGQYQPGNCLYVRDQHQNSRHVPLPPVEETRFTQQCRIVTVCHSEPSDRFIGFKIKVLDCVIGRRRITIQPSLSGLAQNFILKPIQPGNHSALNFVRNFLTTKSLIFRQINQKISNLHPPLKRLDNWIVSGIRWI